MIYGSLRAEFMETKYNSHIHRYGTFVFGKTDKMCPHSLSVIRRNCYRLATCIRYDYFTEHTLDLSVMMRI